MNEAEFIARYQKELPIYKAWGVYVNKVITDSLSNKLGGREELNSFLKIPAKPRVKDLNSLVSKAYYRNKDYTDPYTEITDKVGIRFVVLLKEDIKLISDVINNNEIWSRSKDRDFEKEKLANPTTFDYQSDHYIVKNREKLSVGNTVIPEHTACEIQVRTLLQHAYGELTHDTIYKPKTKASPDIVRSISKSMALIEVTDDIFWQVTMNLKSYQSKSDDFLLKLRGLYEGITNTDYEEKINIFILDAFQDKLGDIQFSDISDLAAQKLIQDTIKRKYQNSLLYRQPIILLIYYLILEKRNLCQDLWPLTDKELQPLFSDLGIAFDSAY